MYNKEIIRISGHANFDDFGKDIVCAGVSSIIYTVINCILSINSKALKVEDNKEMIIHIKSQDNTTNKLIGVMLSELEDLAQEYPQNIIVKENKDVIY